MISKVKFTQPECEAARGAHLCFYSHELAYKVTYEFWLDNRKFDAVYFPERVGTHLTDGCAEV